MIEDNSFANVLKTFRMTKGKELTQKKIAPLLGVGHRKYVGWENRESVPNERELKEIVALFELNEKDKAALYDAAARVAPKIDNLELPRNRFFTGREAQFKQIDQLLKENGTQPIAICGLGGVGKTQLALEYAYRGYREVYRTVLWVNAATKETLRKEYGELADLLELPERSEDNQDKRIQAVKKWLKTYTGWLLILDSVDDLEFAQSFLPATHDGHILLTTRSQIIGTVARHIEIKEMEPKECLLLLLRRSGVLKDETRLDAITRDVHDTALQLTALLGWVPLALDQAGAYISETGVTLADYLQLYKEECRYLLNRRGSSYGDHPDDITATVELSVRSVRKQHPLAADILYFCVFLGTKKIPEELLQQADSLKLDTTSFNEAIATLRRYSLITRNAKERHLEMHQMVQTVLLEGMSPDLRKQWIVCVMRALDKALPEIESQDRTPYDRLLVHVLIWANHLKDVLTPTNEDALEAEILRLFTKFGTYLLKHKHPRIALINLEENSTPEMVEAEKQLMFSQVEKRYGAKHPKTIDHLNFLAVFYLEHHKYEQAEALYERFREYLLETVHLSTARSLLVLAVVAHHQGEHEQAEALSQQAFSFLEQLVGTTQPDDIQALKEYYKGFLNNVQEARDALIGFIDSTEQSPPLINIEHSQLAPLLKDYVFPPAD